MIDNEYKRRGRLRLLRKIAGLLVTVSLIVGIGVWNLLSPFRTYLPAYAIGAREKDEVRIHFLDVGQGDCAIVELADGSVLLIDAGDGAWQHDNHIQRYLRALSPTSVSIVVTHADSDHCGGVSALLRDQRVETVYMPVLPASLGVYEEIGERAAANGVTVRTLTRYGVIAGAGAYFVCISPYSVDETDSNDSSAVLFFSYAGVNVLFGGDITEARESRLFDEQLLFEALGDDLFDSGPYKVRLRETDILKVSHHGSATSSSAAWLGLLRPATAVISCGQGNTYGHPAGAALDRLAAVGADVYRTDELGDVMVTISKSGTYRTEYHYY